MSKMRFKKILSLVLTAFVAIGTLAAGAVQVNAADEHWELWVPTPVWTGTSYGIDVSDWENNEFATITSAKSSDSSVLKVKKYTYDDGSVFWEMKGKKAGKAKITVKFTKPSGETGTIKKTVKVKKFPYEFKSLKVNGKKINIKKNKFYLDEKVSKSKTKLYIKMALKKGWKVIDVYADRSKNGNKYSTFKVSKSAVKKGTAIKFPKKYKYCDINVTMQKGKDIIYYTFSFRR